VTTDGDGHARVAVRATNLGNGITKVRFEVADMDPGLAMQPPSPLLVSSGATEGAVGTFYVDASAGPGPFHATLRFASAYAYDGNLEGDAGLLRVTVWGAAQSTSSEPLHALPGPGVPLLALAAVGALVLLRRRAAR